MQNTEPKAVKVKKSLSLKVAGDAGLEGGGAGLSLGWAE